MLNVLLMLKKFAAIAFLFSFGSAVDLANIPKLENGDPVQVQIGFYIESLGGFRSTDMSFEIDMYFRLAWREPRLEMLMRVINSTESEMIDGSYVIQDLDKLKAIWKPDLYFMNAKRTANQEITVPNFAMFIERYTGQISYSTRIQATVACNMELHRYPMDNQVCNIKIGSYGHTVKEMTVNWLSEWPVVKNEEIDLPEFYITKIVHEMCSSEHNYSIIEGKTKQGNFSCLVAKIYLQRSLGYHIVQTYLPTTLIVTISWMAFWIAPQAVPARVTLSFTTLLTLATQVLQSVITFGMANNRPHTNTAINWLLHHLDQPGTAIRFALPPVSYAKAIDFWYGACMLFLFAGLIEFAIVSNWTRLAQKYKDLAAGDPRYSISSPGLLPKLSVKKLKRQLTLATNARDATEDSDLSDNDLTGRNTATATTAMTMEPIGRAGFLKLCNTFAAKAMRLDQLSRILFPTTFFSLAAFYWLYFYFLWD